MKWFNVRNGHGFINHNDTCEGTFVHQTAITQNSPHKIKRSVGEVETVEFDVDASEKGRAANVIRPERKPIAPQKSSVPFLNQQPTRFREQDELMNLAPAPPHLRPRLCDSSAFGAPAWVKQERDYQGLFPVMARQQPRPPSWPPSHHTWAEEVVPAPTQQWEKKREHVRISDGQQEQNDRLPGDYEEHVAGNTELGHENQMLYKGGKLQNVRDAQ